LLPPNPLPIWLKLFKARAQYRRKMVWGIDEPGAITPVMALTWGVLLAGEELSRSTLIEAGLILLAQVLYQGLIRRALNFFLIAPNAQPGSSGKNV
jgi:hypothetical protein